MTIKTSEREDAIFSAMSELGELMAKEQAKLLTNAALYDTDNNGHFWKEQSDRLNTKYTDLADRIYGDEANRAIGDYNVRVKTWVTIFNEANAL